MKLLIALALFAVANADVKVVNPGYTQPDISPAWVPAEVLAALKEAQPSEDLTVRVVDAPVEQPNLVSITLPEAPQPVVESIPVEPVRIADAPLPAVETIQVVPVRVVNLPEAVELAEAAQPEVSAVRVAESPLPDPVELPQAPQPVVEPVRVVLPGFPAKPAKQYDNPLLR